jgi:hypothetical protein
MTNQQRRLIELVCIDGFPQGPGDAGNWLDEDHPRS